MRPYSQMKVGLHTKVVLVVSLVVMMAMFAGGWFYLSTTRNLLRANDRQARRLVELLSLPCQQDILNDPIACRQLLRGVAQDPAVRYVGLLDAEGSLIAFSCPDAGGYNWEKMNIPVSISSVTPVGATLMVLAQPIVTSRDDQSPQRLIGAVRLVLDTRATEQKLAKAQRQLWLITATIVACSIPLGFLLVWRVLTQPLRKLVVATRQIARGDFTARAGFRRDDEIGELAGAFDALAEEVGQAQRQLQEANEGLELKVVERTEELELANRRLKDEMTEKENFLRAVSHDLSAPLRNISGMAAMILVKWRDQLPPDAIARVERIKANVDVESSMISDLLELSRIRSRSQRRENLDIGALLAEEARNFEDKLKSRNIELTVKGPMPRLYVEKNHLRKVFQNLIDNAIKYMNRPTGGKIEIGCRSDGEVHEFYVSDNGPGIPNEEQQQIFRVFRRSESAANSGVEGKGLGLTTVKTVVSNYEGKAWVRSWLGDGSTFYFTLSKARATIPSFPSKDVFPSGPSGQFRSPATSAASGSDATASNSQQ